MCLRVVCLVGPIKYICFIYKVYLNSHFTRERCLHFDFSGLAYFCAFSILSYGFLWMTFRILTFLIFLPISAYFLDSRYRYIHKSVALDWWYLIEDIHWMLYVYDLLLMAVLPHSVWCALSLQSNISSELLTDPVCYLLQF